MDEADGAEIKRTMKHILTLLVATCLSIIPISLFAAPVSEPITRTANDREFLFESPWLKVAFSREQPKMTYLSVDSLGTGRHHRNLLKAPAGAGPVWKFGVPGGGSPPYAAIQRGNEIRYQPLGARDDPQMSFTISVEPKVIVVAIETGLPGSPGGPGISPWSMVFDATVTPASPLGRTVPDPFPSGREEKAGAPERTTATTLRNVLQGPVLLHFPDWGSLLLNTRAKPALEEAFWRCSLLRDLKPIAPGTVAEWRKMTPAERKNHGGHR